MAKVTFDSLFLRNSDGSFSPRQIIRVGGVTMSPAVRFGTGISFGGIDFTQYIGRNFEIQIDNATMVVTGIYGQGE